MKSRRKKSKEKKGKKEKKKMKNDEMWKEKNIFTEGINFHGKWLN